jgi:hypothetical protein
MATKAQKEELIEALKAEKKKFEISLQGYGGEIAVGRISKEQYEFWKDREDLDEYAYDFENELEIPEEMKLFSDGSWYECDDLEHENGCEFDSYCTVYVYDEDGNEVFSCPLDYSELESKGVYVDGIANDEYRVEHDSDARYYFLGQSIEKGCFQTYIIEDYKFDPAKLNFRINDIEGWNLVTGVSYMSEELDDTGGYSTTGKSSFFKVYAVEENETKQKS